MRQSLRERLSFTDLFMWVVGALIVLIIVYGSISTLIIGRYSPRQWFDFVVNGIMLGSVYALIALGYTLVYGILRMINFAHSEVFMAGAFNSYFLGTALNQSGFLEQNPFVGLLLIFAMAMTTSTIVAVLLERIAYRPLRGAPRIVSLITAIGASFFLQYTFKGLYGAGVKAYPRISVLNESLAFGEFKIIYVQIFVVAAALVLMGGLYYIVQRTKVGKAMRAVAEDFDTAALMGIDVDRIIVITFILGGSLAGAAGVLWSLVFPQVNFVMGFVPGLKAFTAAVLGGIGNIPGAMVGGLFLGLIESIGPSLFLDGLKVTAPHQLKDVIAFTMLVLVLIFRPSGILGEKLTQTKA
ncbi:MAG: branched-chain amino acid ABC transporter permease [Chloroflexota bacterium]